MFLIQALILSAVAGDGQVSLENICDRLVQAGSYSFDASLRMKPSAEASEHAHEIVGKLATGKPAFLSFDGQEVYRSGASLVFKDKQSGKWEKFDRSRAKPSPASGTKEEKKEGEKTGMAEDHGLIILSEIVLPHFLLKDLRGKASEMKMTMEGEKIVFLGNLQEKSIRYFIPPSLLGGTKGEKANFSGTIRVVASKEGTVENVAVSAEVSDRSYQLEYAIKDVNRTEIEVPPEVQPLVYGSGR